MEGKARRQTNFVCSHLYPSQVLVDTSALSVQPALWNSSQEAEKEKNPLIPSPEQQAITAVLKEKVCVSRSCIAMLRKFVSAAIKAGPSAFLFDSIQNAYY